MHSIKKPFEERKVHLAFEISLLLKGAFALAEIVGGIAVYFVTRQFLLDLVNAATQEELTEDPRDFIANHLLLGAQSLSIGARHFAAFYLVSHGVIKLWLIVGLLRKKLWYYPTAIVVFGLFIVYQLYRFSFTHSVWLLLITALDIVVIWLAWYEYKYLRYALSQARRE